MPEPGTSEYHYFWGKWSPLSQWHASTYTMEANGVSHEYNCAEQGMMHGKALLFEDEETAQKILEAPGPLEMKALGREVRGFSDEAWKRHRADIVYRNNVAKFSQNDHLREALLSTTGNLAEASPRDRVWGIGLNERDAKKTVPEKWPGINLLGKILTRVRDEIRN